MWNFSKLALETVTTAGDLSEGNHTEAKYSNYFEDENNNALEDSDPTEVMM